MAGTKRMTADEVVSYLLEDEGADFLRESLKWVVQQLMEAEVCDLVGAEHGGRTAERLTHRNGYRSRRLGHPRRRDRTGDPLDSVGAHQALHPAARHPLAGAPKRLPHAPVAVGVVVLSVQLTDPAQQPLVLDRPSRPLSLGALVVGGRRHAQGAADRLDPETAAMLVDVAAHFGRSGSSSLAKNSDADFRISLARRSS